MSFDLHLQHFAGGDPAPVEPAPVARVLASQSHTGPDSFGFYCVGFEEGVVVEFQASGLEGKEAFTGCAFHVRGISPSLIQFIFEVALSGDFVIFNGQGNGTAESPSVILVSSNQAADLPEQLATECENQPICNSAEMLASLLFPGYDCWEDYRDKIVKEQVEPK